MDKNQYNPELVKKAKELAAGALGREMAKYPVRFCKPAHFGKRPVKDHQVKVNHGTVTFLELDGRPLAVTCSHVLDAYREISNECDTIFQIGATVFNPLERIIYESKELDLVSIDLQNIKKENLINGQEVGSCFFVPPYWPPNEITRGDFVAFAGFPGRWRNYLSWYEISFDSFSSGACLVASVQEDYFVCQFEREYWVESFNTYGRNGMELDDIRGLSGGPVFIYRELYWELVGIIYEFSSEFDLMYVRPIRLLQ